MKLSPASNEVENIQIVKKIIQLTKASESQIEFVKDRPGHDRRYAMGFTKAKEMLGWYPEIEWERGLAETVQWYQKNQDWLDSISSGEYRLWLDTQYEGSI